MATPLQRRDDIQLLDRLDPGEDPGAGDQAVERRLIRARGNQLGAGHHLLPGLGNSQLTGDGQRRAGVVAGDHPYIDPSRPAACDRGRNFRAHRIDQPDQAEQLQPAQDVPFRRQRRGHGDGTPRHRKHPVARGGQPIRRGKHLRRVDPVAHGQYHLGRALDVHGRVRLVLGPTRRRVYLRQMGLAHVPRKGRCKAELRLIGDLADLRCGGAQSGLIDAQLRRQHEKGDVHGVSQMLDRAGDDAQVRLIAQRPGCGKAEQRGLLDRGEIPSFHRDRALRYVALAADIDRCAGCVLTEQQDPLDRHFVHGERAGLVRRDQSAGAQPLDRGQGAHDDVAPRHAVGGNRQGHRNRYRQALWDGGNCQGHGDQKHGDKWQTLGDLNRAEQADQRYGGDADDPAERLQPGDQGRRHHSAACQSLGDAADLGGPSGRRHYTGDSPGEHGRAGIEHVAALGQRHLGAEHHGHIFGHRHRLAGQ